MELISLTKIKGAGAGTATTQLTPKAYQRAKESGKLKDWRLTSDIESVEVIELEDDSAKSIVEVEEIEELVDENFYSKEELEEKTKKELEEIIKNEFKAKGIFVPKTQVKKEVLIDLIIDNQ